MTSEVRTAPDAPAPPLDTPGAVRVARRLLSETLAERWRLFLLSIVCMVGVAGFTGALAYSTRLIVNDVFVAESTSAAFWVAAMVIGVAIGKSVFQYLNAVISVLFDRSISAEYQKRIFRHTLGKDIAQIVGGHAATQMGRIRLFGQAAGKSVVNMCNRLLTDGLTLIALFGVMAIQDPLMTLACSVIIPLIFWLVATLSRRVRSAAAAEAELTGAFFSLGSEALDGIKTVKSYRLEGKSIARFDAAVETLERRLFGIARITSATVPIMEFLGGLVIGLFVIYASWQTITHGKTPGEFTAFISAFLLAYQPAERVSKIWVELQKTLVHVGTMFDMLDEPPRMTAAGTIDIAGRSPEIRFDGVSFDYGPGQPVLRNVSVTIPAGDRVALVGRSGAGKSTLIDLVQRFHDPTEGTVSIGGSDSREIAEDSLRRYVALISQDVFLFDGTIRENIRDGDPDATDAEIEQAARRARLGDLLDAPGGGLDRRIGPNGKSLSGGQRQRVGIARALVKKAGIYIFDEATSALDTDNERRIMQDIARSLAGSTVLFVTHRASTLSYVDRVLVMEDGALVAFDTPDALLRDNPEFQRLFETPDA